jgi:hypothetical protein
MRCRNFLSRPAEYAERQQQPDDSRCDAAEDVPHRVFRKMAREKIAHVVSQRARRSHPDDDQDGSNDQQNYSDNLRYVHGCMLLGMSEQINMKSPWGAARAVVTIGV